MNGRLTLHELFKKQVQRDGNAIAVVFNDTQLTYAQLDEKSSKLALILRSMGVKPGVHVGICLHKSPEMIIAVVAVLKAGGAYVPIDPAFPFERIHFILRDIAAHILLTQSSLKNFLSQFKGTLILLDEPWKKESWENLPDLDSPSYAEADVLEADQDSLAYITYTSGSTGKPKGVQVPHRTVLNLLESFTKLFQFNASDRVLGFSSFSFDIAVFDIFMSLLSGARLVLPESKDMYSPSKLMQLLEDEQITCLSAGPIFWRMLVDAGWQGNPNLRIISSAEALPPDLAKQLIPRGKELWNAYGPTETTVYSSVAKVESIEAGIHIGKPIGNTQFYVTDPEGKPLPPGNPGELLIGGAGVAKGYLNRHELSTAKFIPDCYVPDSPWPTVYRTGDWVTELPDGNFQYHGRMDHQIKIRGFRIELGEIESCLAFNKAIKQAIVIAHPRGDRPEDLQMVAYVQFHPGQAISPHDLKLYLQDYLPFYVIPSAFVTVESFPLTLTGKIDRKAFELPDLSQITGAPAFASAENAFQERLCSLWEEVLEVRPIGIDDNFFELGGHSLKMVQLVASIEKIFGMAVSVEFMMVNQTIRELSGALENREIKKALPMVGFNLKGTQTPIFSTHMLIDFPREIGPDRPFYAFNIQFATINIAPTERSVDKVVEIYQKEILKVQPHGPYNLMGNCLRSPIAVALAKKLNDLGEKVTLILFDPDVPRLDKDNPYFLYRLALPLQEFRVKHRRKGALKKKRALHLNNRQKYRLLTTRISDSDNLPVHPCFQGLRQKVKDLIAIQTLLPESFKSEVEIDYSNFRLQPIDGDIQLFISKEARIGVGSMMGHDGMKKWAPLATTSQIHLRPEFHYKMLVSPAVRSILSLLNEKLH